MTYARRIELFKKIEDERKRPLISYVTSSRQNAAGAIASDVIPELAKQLNCIPKANKSIDLLVVSNGGDPTVAWRMISMMRERFDHIGVLLPYAAFSAATLLALGADEIWMHPFSNLGPVDPQLVYVKKFPGSGGQQEAVERVQFGSEDLRNYLEFVKSDVGISDQEQLERAFELVCKDVGTIPIGVAKRSSYLALSMGEKLLSLHMKDKDASKPKVIAESLNKSFYHHGYPLSRKEGKEMGLPIREPDDILEKLLWQVWEDIEEEMNCNRPFDPLEVALNNPDIAKIISPLPQVQIPAGLPPQIQQQALQHILQQIQIIAVNPMDYELFNAALESIRCRSVHKTRLKISAVRLPDLNIAVNVAKVSQGWTFSKNNG